MPYVVRSTQNNGVRGYIVENKKYANEQDTLSFAQDTFTVFYHKLPYFTGNKVKILKPRFNRKSENILRFITACFQQSLRIFTWGTGSTIDTIAETKISLPTKDNQIDFDFMENFIAELEARRIAELEARRITELEAYLSVTGLKDYKLTREEEKVLESYATLPFKKYPIEEIFDVKNTSNILSCDIIENSGTAPYLCASADSNAVSSYISYDEKYLEQGNCVFIGGKTFVVSYQEKDFYSNDSHNLALYLKNENRTKLNHLYLVTCVYKSLCHKYSWGDSVSKTKIKSDCISLPTKDGRPDFSTMDTFISAIQKLVIKDAVLYTDRKIEETKKLVGDK